MVTHPYEAKAMINYSVWRDPLNRIEDNAESGWSRADMKKCWDLLDATSRSFSAVIKELEGDLSRVVAIFYLALRGLDTIEDDMTLSIEKKAPLLESFYLKLEEDGWNFTESGPNEKDRDLLVQFHHVIAEFKLLKPEYRAAIADITKKMGAGMSRYAKLHAENGGKFSVDTLASFDLYCHYVAGLVGEGLSRLFSASGKESPHLGEQLSLSNSMGLMLQKTNIMRDFREDTDEGRVFWPAEIWKKYADKPEDLYAPGNEQKAMWALSEMTVDALTHATDALDYLTLLSNQSVFNFCAIPQVMAVATLQECFMNPKVMHQNVKIRKGKALSLIMSATNPRDVAYLFRDTLRAIHRKAVANDPSFIKIAVLAGRVEQWTEAHYPSFINFGMPVPKNRLDWVEGMDVRIKQLPGPTAQEIALVERRKREEANLGSADFKLLAMIIGAALLFIASLIGLGYGGLWWFIFRDGAPYAEYGLRTNSREYAEKYASAAVQSVVESAGAYVHKEL